MRLTWTPNVSASALHAAEAIHLHRQKLTDQRVLETLTPYTGKLGAWIENAIPYDIQRFWTILLGNAPLIDSNLELAQTVLRKSGLRANEQSATTQLAGLISDIETSFIQLYPKFLEQLPLRARPLQEQWLGFGAGLTAHLGRLTQKSLLVDEARVVLLQPVLGGAGFAHMEQNFVRMEAVLTNPMVELPEIVRLTWMLSQLNLELPIHSETVGMNLIGRIGPLAMLPATLAAAEVMELSKCDESVAALAIEHWHIATPKDKDVHEDIVPALLDWWETFLQTRPATNTALQALSKMLGLE